MRFKITQLILALTLGVYTAMSFKGYYHTIKAINELSIALSADLKRFILNTVAFSICLIICVLAGWFYNHELALKKIIGAAAYIAILLPGCIGYLWFSNYSAAAFIIYTICMVCLLNAKKELSHST